MLEISNADYRQIDAVSASDLKMISRSPAYYKWAKENPVDSSVLMFGRAAHKIMLEPDTFFDEFAVAPSCDRRTKEGKEEYAKFVEDSKGKDILSAETMQTLQEMRDAMMQTPFVKKLLEGDHEKSFLWTDDETGLALKCRPDSVGKIGDEHIIIDYKTCKSAKTDDFIRDANKLLYDVQAVHYCEGMKANTGNDYKFIFIAQEKTAPYLVNILEANENFMAIGEETRRDLLNIYKECKETGNWWGYMHDGCVNVLSAPKWLEKQMGYESEGED